MLTVSSTSLSSIILSALTALVSTTAASLDECKTVDEAGRGEVEEGSVGCTRVGAAAAVSSIPLSVDAVLLTVATEPGTGTEPVIEAGVGIAIEPVGTEPGTGTE